MAKLQCLILSLLLSQTLAVTRVLINGRNGNTQQYFPSKNGKSSDNLPFGIPTCQDARAVAFNNLVYYTGGLCHEKISQQMTIFRPVTETSSPGPQLIEARYLHGIATYQQKVIICGGRSATKGYLHTCEQYEKDANAWTPFPSLPLALRSFSMLTLNKRVYVFGGLIGPAGDECYNTNRVFMFDGSSWVERAEMPIGLQAHSAAVLDDTRALICGGYAYINSSCQVSKLCFIYSSEHNVWTSTQPMSIIRWDHSMVNFDGKIYIMGGFENKDTVELWTEENGGVIIDARLSMGDYDFTAVVI